MGHAAPRGYVSARSAPATNARRFAPGLPLLALRRTRAEAAPDQPSAASPTQYVHISTATAPDMHDFRSGSYPPHVTGLGKTDASWNDFGEYGIIQGDQSGSLEVSLSSSATATDELDLTATNTPGAAYPYWHHYWFRLHERRLESGRVQLRRPWRHHPPGSSPSNTGDNSFSHATAAPATIEARFGHLTQRTMRLPHSGEIPTGPRRLHTSCTPTNNNC
ncbi:hypothetical protein DFH08DRAFT_1084661 [Mycena albidolilacea]|uniref:Uncharacterized protein n=1 Tax=Mycena albidolilacea TaxID=1033008 RepID=A0AAD6ZLM9_9AGAR|nr:hypothetical protein DFH08DRAFT_1084661 [Mycena albidolilacea]